MKSGSNNRKKLKSYTICEMQSFSHAKTPIYFRCYKTDSKLIRRLQINKPEDDEESRLNISIYILYCKCLFGPTTSHLRYGMSGEDACSGKVVYRLISYMRCLYIQLERTRPILVFLPMSCALPWPLPLGSNALQS
jgi:hypothetical protein